MTDRLETTILADLGDLERLAPAWARLWRRCPAATPFQHPAWLVPWWTAFHPGRLQAVAVHAAEDLVGLAPLYLETGPFGPRLLPMGIGVSDYLDALVDPDQETLVGAAIARATSGVAVHWEDLMPGAAALRLPVAADGRVRLEPQQACPVLDLPAGQADLSAAVPPTRRRKVRMARNRAASRGLCIEAATPERAPAVLSDLVRLHGTRWASRGEPGVLADAEVVGFHAQAVPRLLAAGLLRLYEARIAGTVAGVFYGLQTDRHAYAYLGGFDPAFTFESPGTLLLAHAIEQAMTSGVEAFHFLRGREAYKYEWGAVDRWTSRRVIEPSA